MFDLYTLICTALYMYHQQYYIDQLDRMSVTLAARSIMIRSIILPGED